MNRMIILLVTLFLVGCKTTEKCDAYGSTIVFPPMHIHDWSNNKWNCYEFPADTLRVNNILTIK